MGPCADVALSCLQVAKASAPTCVVLESQFRPSQGNYVIEVSRTGSSERLSRSFVSGSAAPKLPRLLSSHMWVASVQVPAGLVDEGETVEQAAVRELKEETGAV